MLVVVQGNIRTGSCYRVLLMLCLLLWPVHESISQGHTISGRVTDSETGQAIESLTVYINGTSKGTITDGEGNFSIEGVHIPSELILSHVSYELRLLQLNDASHLETMELQVPRKIIGLEEVTVIHDQLRQDYIRRFKAWFLGLDYEEQLADILNDSVLIFHVKGNDQFSVQADGRILVDLPATGYILEVDLVNFRLMYTEEFGGYHASTLGYYYFRPLEYSNQRKQRLIARNRVETYYNSSMHFCRSLYRNHLAENGYTIHSVCPAGEDMQNREFTHEIKADYGKDQFGNELLTLTQFNCAKFRITYHYNSRNRPVDLTFLDPGRSYTHASGLQILKDTVRIYPSGRIPENSMLFSNSIGKKGVASMLPEDYIPSMQ